MRTSAHDLLNLKDRPTAKMFGNNVIALGVLIDAKDAGIALINR